MKKILGMIQAGNEKIVYWTEVPNLPNGKPHSGNQVFITIILFLRIIS